MSRTGEWYIKILEEQRSVGNDRLFDAEYMEWVEYSQSVHYEHTRSDIRITEESNTDIDSSK